MRLLACSSLALAVVLFSAPVLAADAYDEEDEVQRPEDSGFEDEDSDEDGEGEGLETGGLQAPDALGEVGDSRSEIEKELEESDEKDSGRGLEFAWLGGEVGYQAVGLEALSSSGLAPAGVDTSGGGLTFGGAIGLRVIYFTLGPRFRFANLSAFQHWSLLGEVALRIPIGNFEPFAMLGAGYAKVDGLSGGTASGADVRLGGGVHYYFSDSFSVGAQVGGDLLFLSSDSGSGIGAGLATTALVGLHF